MKTIIALISILLLSACDNRKCVQYEKRMVHECDMALGVALNNYALGCAVGEDVEREVCVKYEEVQK